MWPAWAPVPVRSSPDGEDFPLFPRNLLGIFHVATWKLFSRGVRGPQHCTWDKIFSFIFLNSRNYAASSIKLTEIKDVDGARKKPEQDE